MEERFPSWFPILSVAAISGAIGWWLGRREGQLSARVAGLEAPRRRMLRARTGEEQLTYSASANEEGGSTTDAKVSLSEEEGHDPGGMTLSLDSPGGAEGQSSTDRVTLGPDESPEATATAAPHKPKGPAPMRGASRTLMESAPAPRMRAVTTDSSEHKPATSAPEEGMKAASEYSVPMDSTPKRTVMPSGGRPAVHAEVVSDARQPPRPMAPLAVIRRR